MLRFYISFISLLAVSMVSQADDGILNGTILNNSEKAFDGDPSTYSASTYNFGWAGLDLGTRHVITKVGWMPRDNVPSRMILGVFEGANSPDFMDALPIHIIRSADEVGKPGVMSYAEVSCSQGFRYVRYVGPATTYAHVAELQFFGHEGMGDHSNLFRITNLPTVSIHTINNTVPRDKVNEIQAHFIIIGDSTHALISEPGTIRERGNYSREYPKKPWRIKFEQKQHVLDAPAHARKWTLINNYGDKTLMRNLLAFDVSRRLDMAWTPEGRLVDVIFNGEYKGTYQLCDQVQVHEDRVAVTKMEKTDNYGDFVTGGYLIELDAYASGEPKWFTSSTYRIPISIKYPDAEDITPYQEAYIKSQWNAFERTVSSTSYADPEKGYASMLDVPSFVKHFLVGEYSGNTDTYWSVNVWKDRDDPRFHIGPVWDFDLAFENDNRTHPISSIGNTFIALSSRSSAANGVKSLIPRIINTTKDLQCEEWSIARFDRGLSADGMIHLVDSLAEMADVSQQLNFIRWPILSSYVHQNFQALGNYTAEVEFMKTYITSRMDWMDNKVGLDEKYSTIELPMASVMKGNVRSGVGGILLEGWPEGTKVTVCDVAGNLRTNLVTNGFFVTVPLPSGFCVATLITPDGASHHVKAYVR